MSREEFTPEKIMEWKKKAEKWDKFVNVSDQMKAELRRRHDLIGEFQERFETVRKLLDEAEIELRAPKFGKSFVIPVFIRRLRAVVDGVAEEDMK